MARKKKNRGKKTNKVKPEVRQKISALETPIEPSNSDVLDRIIRERAGKTFSVDPDIDKVRAYTARVESVGKKTKKREFYYNDGKFVKEGVDYHTYYTTNLEQYYMTGVGFSRNSKLIFSLRDESDFAVYNLLKPKQSLVVEPNANIAPTEKDYKKGIMTRYFAKKITEVNSKIMEITKEKMDASPLYRYVSLTWLLTGEKTQVFLANRRSIEQAARVMPSIGKFVPTFQFYRKPKNNLKTKQGVMDRLGIQETNIDIPVVENTKIKKGKDSKSRKGRKKRRTSSQSNPFGLTGTHTMPDGTVMPGSTHEEYLEAVAANQEQQNTTGGATSGGTTSTTTGPPAGVTSGGAGGGY
tara:strand:- start:428 stop:1489 length:1062 start_codon:yes stop_codon:yes gene_type:complete